MKLARPCLPFNNRPALRRSSFAGAFTLVEILIVVMILGILAAIVLPQFSNASHQARENTLKDDLRYLRTQIGVYKAQHRDVAPGEAVGSNFISQMTLYTDETGATAAAKDATHKFGPYLSRMPANPLNTYDTITVSNAADLSAEIDDLTGWIYNPETEQIIANQSGADDQGTLYAQY